MLLIFQTFLGILASAQLANLAPSEQQSPDFVCINKSCYVISWNSKKYQGANKLCKKQNGQLMEVRSSVEAEVINILMEKAERESSRVWIGLELPPRLQCTDLSKPLRGFTWTTGDSNTDYTKWKDNERKCGPRCVSVNENQTWEESNCEDKTDGFVCVLSFPQSCSPIPPSEWFDVTYETPFGLSDGSSLFLPPGTSAYVSNIAFPLVCNNTGNGTMRWTSETPGAWNCVVENGGCEFICDGMETPVCQCETGRLSLKDGRTCTRPCDSNPCEQQCVQMRESEYQCMCDEGYKLVNRTRCQDIDDCGAHPDICDQICINTPGSFLCKCHPGFEMIDGQCEDIDECDMSICEDQCNNTYGSYSCSCSSGYIVDDKNPNKCKQFCGQRSCEALCDPNDGLCNCPDGYVLDDLGAEGKFCVKIDECDSEPCKGMCINNHGSFECICPEGFTLEKDTSCTLNDGPTTEMPPIPTKPPTPESLTLQPAMLLGICIGILSMLTVIIAIICHMVRKHYMDNHAMDYNEKSLEKEVALQQVKTVPQHKL
ncbi:thrombomodulin [Pelobates cultripes]|uniref:Thrombomodulin n=1 Tax=Pelobates cultripes TaxID=61616 RepID=A0AAD1RHE7_PELCU|nr:thrombomodulin [Pelobates cultripes]